MNDTFMSKVGSTFHKIGFQLQKSSPEIFAVLGVIGVVGGAVMACKATLKLDQVMTESKEKINHIHDAMSDPGMVEVYSAEDGKKDLAIAYAKTGLELAKIYWPAAVVEGLGIASMLTSHGVLRKRNTALSAACAAIGTSFNEYRKRVVDKYGEEIENEIRYDIQSKKVETTVTDEKGKEKKTKTTVKAPNPNASCDFARVFEPGNPYWERGSDYNLMFLRSRQQLANDKLVGNGHLFLNEVYDMLGIDQERYGQIVGWVYDPNNASHPGDNYVNFRIKEIDAIEGQPGGYLLDFNVDGSIIDAKIW